MGIVSPHKKTEEAEIDRVDALLDSWRAELPGAGADALHIVGRIQFLGNRYESDANQSLKQFGIKYTDFDVLGTLRRIGAPYKLSPTQLCESVLITSGAMTAALDRLERAGLIHRMPDPNDRRVKVAVLTEKGLTIVEQAAMERFAAAQKTIEHLDESEQAELTRLLRKLVVEADRSRE
ncbi:MAG: MarR family transcriptional regulator [Hyphomonadaceae bacterium]